MAAAPESMAAIPAAAKLPTPGPEPTVEEIAMDIAQPADNTNHRSSTFLTEVEDTDEAGSAVTSIADIVAAVEKVEVLGSVEDVDDTKETSPAPAAKEASAASKEASLAPEKEETPAK